MTIAYLLLFEGTMQDENGIIRPFTGAYWADTLEQAQAKYQSMDPEVRQKLHKYGIFETPRDTEIINSPQLALAHNKVLPRLIEGNPAQWESFLRDQSIDRIDPRRHGTH